MSLKSETRLQGLRKSIGRLARFFEQLMREQLGSGPITVQQCYTLEALSEGARSMTELAEEVALHQSTMTRIVEKLEKKGLVNRKRQADNQRVVMVDITEAGWMLYEFMSNESTRITEAILEMAPEEKRESIVETVQLLAELLDHKNDQFRAVFKSCCAGNCGNGGKK